MRLWMIQDQLFWDNLQREGYIVADPVLCAERGMYKEECFRDAYTWLIKHMCQKIPNSPKDRLPLWAWYQWRSRLQQKPDLRTYCHDFHGFRLEIKLPDDQVLLTDFELWHWVLNHDYIPYNYYELNFDLDDERWDIAFRTKEKLSEEELEKSWEAVLDISLGWKQRNQGIQGTFWELHLDQVVKVDEFGKGQPEPGTE